MENRENANSVSADSASKPEAEKVVSKTAYEDVSKDMHKYKSKAKELEASLNEYQVKLKSIEEEKLMEANRYKELYEKRTQELEVEKSKTHETHSKFLKSLKMIELKRELGVSIRDEYLVHADLSSIEINEDGSLNKDSLVTVANKFRQEHGTLIPKSDNVGITGHAASNGAVTPPKSINEMTMAEKIAELNKLKKQ